MEKIKITGTNKLILTVALLLTVFPLIALIILYRFFNIDVEHVISQSEMAKVIILLIDQYGFIFLPVIIFTAVSRINIKEVFRLNPINLPAAIATIFIALAVWFISQYFTIIIYQIYSGIFGPQENNLTDYIPNNIALGVFLIALTPAICEEALFRGITLKAYENRGTIRAIVISSLLFAMIHQSVINFIGPLFIGLTAAFLVVKSNSIIPGILTHFTFNFTSTMLYYYNQKRFPEEMERFPTIPEYAAMFIFVVFSAAVVLAGIIAFIYFVSPKKMEWFEKPITKFFYKLVFWGTPEEKVRFKKPIASAAQDIVTIATHWPIAVLLFIVIIFTVLGS